MIPCALFESPFKLPRPSPPSSIPPSWFSGLQQFTPDLAPIYQEILGRPGWVEGNHATVSTQMPLGSEHRPATSYDKTLEAQVFAPMLVMDVGVVGLPNSYDSIRGTAGMIVV